MVWLVGVVLDLCMCISNTPPLNLILFFTTNQKNCYHPISVLRCRTKVICRSGFVKISVYWSSVRMWWMMICLEFTYERKWWYLICICLVHGRYLCSRAISKAPILSSKTLHWTRVCEDAGTRSWVAISLRRCIIGIASRNAQLSPMYSDLLLLRAITT